jgi:hypothetical protein
MKLFYILLFLLLMQSTGVSAQATDSVPVASGIAIFADPRLEQVLAAFKPKSVGGTAPNRGVIRSGRGFRIQIYNGNDRNRANEVKLDFLRKYPGMRAYMTYIQPQYRVKVGDFRSRAEAHALYRELSNIYTPVIIVPDIIVINTFRNDP